MDSQLTICKLIKILEKIRKQNGDDVPVYHVSDCGELVKTHFAYEDEIKDEDYDYEKVKIVVIGQ